jgi:hypothetical protein
MAERRPAEAGGARRGRVLGVAVTAALACAVAGGGAGAEGGGAGPPPPPAVLLKIELLGVASEAVGGGSAGPPRAGRVTIAGEGRRDRPVPGVPEGGAAEGARGVEVPEKCGAPRPCAGVGAAAAAAFAAATAAAIRKVEGRATSLPLRCAKAWGEGCGGGT